MPGALAVVSYPVRDLAAARAFFEAVLDLAASSANDAEVRFERGEVCLQLVVDRRVSPPAREGVLLTFCVDDLDRAVAAAERLGGTCALRREVGEHGHTARTATLAAPFGSYVALEERTRSA